VRMAWQDPHIAHMTRMGLAADLGIPREVLLCMLGDSYFGAAWAEIEANSPLLPRRRVRFADLPGQIAYARELLMQHNVWNAARLRLGFLLDPAQNDQTRGWPRDAADMSD